MLGGLDPIIIFQFSKSLVDLGISDEIQKIPVIGQVQSLVDQPPIPIYLSESLTGLYIDSEDKNVDIETETNTLTSGEEPEVNQKGIGSSLTVNLVARKDSLGLTLLSAMIDLVFEKVTSKEYSITYLHGPTTIFRGVLRSFAINQNASNELVTIKIELTRGQKQPTKKPETIVVPGSQGTIPGDIPNA